LSQPFAMVRAYNCSLPRHSPPDGSHRYIARMQSTATTVKDYLASLPPDRRKAVTTLRALIRKNLPPGYREVVQYGIGWVVYPEIERWFKAEYAKSGKKLNMGKCCLRFRSLEEIPLELIAKTIAHVSMEQYIATCDSVRGKSLRAARAKGKSASKS
jgi:uncharacterized protein YdhG (YjbR/CyaY superfamily)